MNKPQAGGLEVHRANALALRLELGRPAVATVPNVGLDRHGAG